MNTSTPTPLIYDHRGNPITGTRASTASAKGAGINDLGQMIHDVIGPGSSLRGERWTDKECVDRLDHWVFVCTRAIHDAVCKVPLKCFRQDGTEIEPLADPLVQMMCDVNPLDTRVDLWTTTIDFLELTGNSVWLKVRDLAGNVREIWPLPSHRMRPHRIPGQVPTSFELDGLNGTIPIEDVVHIKYPNPKDKFWGIGTLQYAQNALLAHDKISASRLAAFNNEILASLYFYCDGLLSDPQWKRIRQMLVERYASPENARTPLILENQTKVASLNPKPAEMDYPNSARMTRDEILAIFGVMPIFAGIIDSANRSNSETQEKIFLGNTILSRLIRIQERINKDAELSAEGRVWKFDDPTPKNKAEEATVRTKDMTSGATAANDHRPDMGLEETEWGRYPKWVWELMLKHGIEELSEDAVAQLLAEKRERAESLALQLAGQQDGGPNQPGTGGDEPPPEPSEDDPANDPGGRGVQVLPGRPVGVRMFQRQPLTRSAEMDSILAQARTDQDVLERQTARAMRRYFSDQLERVIENVRRIYDHLPQRNAVSQIRMPMVLTLAGTEPCRLYPDGSLVLENGGGFAGGRGVIGQAVVPQDCLHSSVECGFINVRSIDPSAAEQLDDWAAASAELASVMEEHIRNAIKRGGDLTRETLKLSGAFDMRNPYAEQFMAAKQREYWLGTVSETTKRLLSEKLGEVLAKGATVDELEEAVKFTFGGETKGKSGGGKYGKGRFASARTIARTETIGAYNGGADIQRVEAGVRHKEWVATFDDFTRATHFAADGQVVNQGGLFRVGGAQLRYPGDPEGPVAEIVNCRCFSVASFPED